MKIARSSSQELCLRSLVAGRSVNIPGYSLRGSARNYAGKYNAAFYALLERMRSAGYVVGRTPGPKGGEFSATYRILGVLES